MHETSIATALLERVEHEARSRGARAVHRLSLAIGELAGVEVDQLASAFELCRVATLAAGATLVVRRVPARWQCPRCERELVRGAILRCPECAAPGRLTAGDEILLERIEMEVA